MEPIQIRKFISPEILTGSGVRKLAGNYFRGMDIRKVLIVTDTNVEIQRWFNEVLQSLTESQVDYVIFDQITQNSPDNEVMQGLEVYHENTCKGILAIGGGSVIDSAKAIGIVYTNHRHILNFEGVDKIRVPSPPLVCIPSTSGSASDVSQFAIIRDMSRMVKIAIVSKSLVPDISLIDPELTTTMDQHLTACTGMDALTHAIEAFVSNGHSPITDMYALEAIRLIGKSLPLATSDLENAQYRFEMNLGCLYAGLAFSNASLGAVHALAHSIGGFYNSNHGETNALLLDHVIRFNMKSDMARYAQVAQALNTNIHAKSEQQLCDSLVENILELKMNLRLGYTLHKIGIKQDDVHLLARNARYDACILTNPRTINIDDLKAILTEAI